MILSIINILRIQIMIHEPMLGHRLIFCSRLSPVAVRINRDAASRVNFPHTSI